MTPIAFGLAVGFGIAGFRAGPNVPHGSRLALVAVIVLAMLVAYLAGLRRGGRNSAVAVASATSIAEAVSTSSAQSVVNVFVAPADLNSSRPEAASVSVDRSVPAVPGHLAPALSPVDVLGDSVDDFDVSEYAEAAEAMDR